MILRPPNPPTPDDGRDFVPVWDAVLRSQKQAGADSLLIMQKDHAVLAGEMARRIANPDFPPLDEDVLQAIAVHDDGWASVDTPDAPHTNKDGRPLSFFEESPADIFRAWNGSITRASEVAPIADILVSEHFCRIARDFAHAPTTPAETAHVLTTFLEREMSRQEELRERQSRTAQEIDILVDVLQFFDLLSLYVCCGSQEPVEFPQRFKEHNFRLRHDGDFSIAPPVFADIAHFRVNAYRVTHHPQPAAAPGSIAFKLV